MKDFCAKFGYGSGVNSFCTWCGGIFVEIYSSVQLLNLLKSTGYVLRQEV